MKNVTWRVDVGCSGPGKAGANRPKGRGTDHPAVGRKDRHHCSPVELDARRRARPVRGRLTRVIPSSQSAVNSCALEGVIRGFYPIRSWQFVRRATEKSLAQAARRSGGLNVGRDGQKAGGQLCKKLLQNYESCPGGSGALARSTWLSWGVFIWRQMKPEQSTPASGRKTRRRKAQP
jgi:hypothetical protein